MTRRRLTYTLAMLTGDRFGQPPFQHGVIRRTQLDELGMIVDVYGMNGLHYEVYYS